MSVVAIDVGGTALKGALIDRDGHTLELDRRSARAQEGPQAVVDELLALAGSLAGREPRPKAIGLAVPGVVDELAGVVVNSANLGWRELAIGPLVQERLDVEVMVSHDVRAGAIAEGLIGAARDSEDYLLITLGTGVGAAVVLGGQPYLGAHGVAGELGHVVLDPDGPRCGCGARGCLEAIASAGHIVRRYAEARGEDPSPAGAEEVARAAAAGDPVAVEVWSRALAALALAIANYSTLLDPELVVIGGGMASAGDALFDPLRRLVRSQVRFGAPPAIVPAALGEDAGYRGAAIAAWRGLGVRDDELRAWKL